MAQWCEWDSRAGKKRRILILLILVLQCSKEALPNPKCRGAWSSRQTQLCSCLNSISFAAVFFAAECILQSLHAGWARLARTHYSKPLARFLTWQFAINRVYALAAIREAVLLFNNWSLMSFRIYTFAGADSLPFSRLCTHKLSHGGFFVLQYINQISELRILCAVKNCSYLRHSEWKWSNMSQPVCYWFYLRCTICHNLHRAKCSFGSSLFVPIISLCIQPSLFVSSKQAFCIYHFCFRVRVWAPSFF